MSIGGNHGSLKDYAYLSGSLQSTKRSEMPEKGNVSRYVSNSATVPADS